MSKVCKHLSDRRDIRKKLCLLRIIVISLSLISLISRLIYCTFATWLTITTFDCIPCPNTSAHNGSSHLFTAHHSSAVFKTIRSLNVESMSKKIKRAYNLNQWIPLSDNHSDYTKESTQTETKDNIESTSGRNTINFQTNNTQSVINNSIGTDLLINNLLSNPMSTKAEEGVFSSFFDDSSLDPKSIDPSIDSDLPLSDTKTSTESHSSFDKFTDVSDQQLLGVTINSQISSKDANNDFKIRKYFNGSEDVVDRRLINRNELLTKSGSNGQKSNQDPGLGIVTHMNVCSEECAHFLTVELSDPTVRKWATIVITCVLYLYAMVMLSVVVSTCLAMVDLLVLSTFIEGAKLFAGFVLIIIDCFNGRELHFDLIDLKFNVNSSGNGWTADFSYSEYLLDLIIFLSSIFLCIKVFKCFERRPRNPSSIEDLNETRGTYRANSSFPSLEPIFERN